MNWVKGVLIATSLFVMATINAQTDERPLPKTQIDQYLAESCVKIRESIAQKNKLIKRMKMGKATQYFTPLFRPGSDGGLREVDRRACINIEGSCIVGEYLYNWVARNRPWGKRFDRASVPFKFGMGSGRGNYNTTNALDPCRTLAADSRHNPAGTVVYIPSMRNKLCPQTGKPVDGCFIVGDVGSAIKGKRRFDIFTGECADYNKRNNTCRDPLNNRFVVSKGATYYRIGRHNRLAKELREEVDRFILSDWTKTFPF